MRIKSILSCILAGMSILPCLAAKQKSADPGKALSPSPEWLESAVIYEANLRQGTQTRDLKGLQRELPRLRDLGIDIVWLMPIHPISVAERKGTLGSYYAVQDYKGVNPEFGTLGDLKEFVRTAHSLGMKVILDEVCNHTGVDHPWVKDHPEYYARNKEGKMFGPYDWTDVYKLDYSKPEVREAMTDALLYWVSEADIDGYRCDVAGEVPTDFWEEARPKLQAVKPVMMLAEAAKPELLRKGFDIDYAWPMKDVFNAIAATKGVNEWATTHNEKRPEMTAANIPALLERQKKEYPKGARHMNMVTNHDLNSWEGTEFDRYGEATGAFAVLSYTLPGAPMMYTGQEVGFNHAFEFFEQDSITPDYDQNEFTAFYKSLNSLKHNYHALNASSPIEFFETKDSDVLAFRRSAADGSNVYVIANLSPETKTLKVSSDKYNLRDAINWFTSEKAELPTDLQPWQYLVFVSK